MSKSGINFFEEHVEKIVFGIVGLVCLWLFVFHVFMSPNEVEYDGRKHGAGELDRYILERHGKTLERNVGRAPEPPEPYKARVPEFLELVKSPIEGIDARLYLPQPIYSTKDYSDKSKYQIPLIGAVTDAEAEHIRVVAHVPQQEVTEEQRYEQTELELHDIDLVTVEGQFDTAGLFSRFEESFAGFNVPAEWRDPCLAKPVFAKVQLERQELLSDGSWGEWQVVPRIKIDPYKQMFEVMDNLEGQPHGWLRVRQLHFDNAEIRKHLLQPEAYRIASSNEEWFPPKLHKKYAAQWSEIKAEERRRERELEKEEREREQEEARKEREQGSDRRRSDRRGTGMGYESSRIGGSSRYSGTMYGDSGNFGSRTSSRRSSRSGGRTSNRFGGGYGYGDMGDDSRASRLEERDKIEREKRRLAKRRALERRMSIREIYDEYKGMLLSSGADLSKLREPLTFWAHDDTVEPGRIYRYRLGLGVFNPIAGTERFADATQSEQLKDKAILWSSYSEVTEAIEIPETLYFFPRDIQETARMVTVEVFRYVLGYWYSEDFAVKQGEVIGKAVEPKIPVETAKSTDKSTTSSISRSPERVTTSTSFGYGGGGEVVLPEMVDYDTGAVLVDVVPVNDWAGTTSLYARRYYDMLYSYDGGHIERIAVGTRYWPEQLRAVFNDVKQAQKEPRQPFRSYDSTMGEMDLEQLELQYQEDEYDYELEGGIDDTTRTRRRRSRY